MDAASVIQSSMQRIPLQFNPDGSQPLETNRTNSWYYSVYNLEAHFAQGISIYILITQS